MPSYRHATPGSVVVSKRVVVSDALVRNSETEVQIQQPKDSVVDKVYLRCLEGAKLAAVGDIGLEVGTASSGAQAVATQTDGVLDGGTTVPAGFMLELAPTATVGYSAASNAAPKAVVQTEDRTLYCTLIAPDVAITDAGKFEWTIVFRIVD